MLFNGYINSLANELTNQGYNIFYYADDLAVIAHGLKKVATLIRAVEVWCKRNIMEINKSKCGVMLLAGQQQMSAKELEL
jgi:3-methyladenine DNA glycosylase Mpg